jgi:hypothetical protein
MNVWKRSRKRVFWKETEQNWITNERAKKLICPSRMTNKFHCGSLPKEGGNGKMAQLMPALLCHLFAYSMTFSTQ